jgi:MoxR-like ATPase
MTTTLYTVAETAERMAGILDFQENERGLVNRRTEMRGLQTALIGRLHVMLHGLPGVAKSLTVDGVLMHMPELRLFATQMSKVSPPEQLLGPISLRAMAEDRFTRITTGKLADCEVAFVDELPRGPRALLPAMHSAMVERRFDAGDGYVDIDLMTLIGTSNHLPDDEEIAAFLDRFALKYVVKGPQSQQQFMDIMRGALQRDERGEPTIPDELVVSIDELKHAQKAREAVNVPDAILATFGELWSNLLAAGVQPSPRRYVDVVRAMQATALLEGRDEVGEDDLQVATHSLWTSEDEIPVVYENVVAFASTWVKERAQLLDTFQGVLDRLGTVQSMVASGADAGEQVEVNEKKRSLTDHGLAVVGEQRKLRPLIEQHIASASNKNAAADLEAALTQMDAAKDWVSDRLLGGLNI